MRNLILNFFCIIAFFVISEGSSFAQIQKKKESDFHIGIDMQTKYVWRGMEMMSVESAPVIFPQLNYQYQGLYAYVMGGYAINGKYAEVDLGVSYTYKWVTFGINGYYYPTTSEASDQYFKFKNNETGHWWEATLAISTEKIPVNLTLSNFFAGADRNHEGKQAFSSYAELGTYRTFLNNHKLALNIGAALNKSCYNGYEHSFSICNIEGKYTYNLTFGNGFILPLSVSYILNPVYEKAHVNFMMNLAF